MDQIQNIINIILIKTLRIHKPLRMKSWQNWICQQREWPFLSNSYYKQVNNILHLFRFTIHVKVRTFWLQKKERKKERKKELRWHYTSVLWVFCKLLGLSSFFSSFKFLHKYLPLAISTKTQKPFWTIWKIQKQHKIKLQKAPKEITESLERIN